MARGLSVAAGALVRSTSRLFGEIKTRSESAYGDFQARPEHARWRAYALGSYGLIVLATLLAQLYSANPMGVYVKAQHVDIPASTIIFVRNDSSHPWHNAKVTLNGVYNFDRPEVAPGASLRLNVDQFTFLDAVTGKPAHAPKTLEPQSLALDCDRGHFETELKP
jgi:hypothetical protein